MAATSLWRSYRLDSEFNRVIGDISALDSVVGGEARRVIAATKVFAADSYALPGIVDSKVRELYPRLMDLSRESCYISESALEGLAKDICKPRPKYVVPDDIRVNRLSPTYQGSYVAPCGLGDNIGNPSGYVVPSVSGLQSGNTTTIFPPYNNITSVHTTDMLTGNKLGANLNSAAIGRSDDFLMKSPLPHNRGRGSPVSREDLTSIRRPDYLNSEHYKDRVVDAGFRGTDLFGSRSGVSGLLDNCNIFDADSYRGHNFDGAGAVDTASRTPMKSNSGDFNFHREFMSAFQPESEPRTDYHALNTPVADLESRKKDVNDGLVSPFPWERNMDAKRMSDVGLTSVDRVNDSIDGPYPSYISGRGNNGATPGGFRGYVFDDPMNMFDGSVPSRINKHSADDFVLRDVAKSPLRSLMRDSDHSYGYKGSYLTPRVLYHSLL
ncbi:hypothetical protein BBOV_III006730 [Babesia bovis T2Bo]|uniref:Uncharacterized protein n=1 Tax=Babesia bovis TaxID=5865 RepID=A7ANV0_BABBO|nr:hypothetical protein BBOV_III006730 [Babesia bovis T2Bo]EDO08234.1 hypothetical protein BBOV_III006730 [Babesia bovis T2Bo]|eukprot:XP_001611802.1 hypothetical protein [Babesia bovis T2Bo]